MTNLDDAAIAWLLDKLPDGVRLSERYGWALDGKLLPEEEKLLPAHGGSWSWEEVENLKDGGRLQLVPIGVMVEWGVSANYFENESPIGEDIRHCIAHQIERESTTPHSEITGGPATDEG